MGDKKAPGRPGETVVEIGTEAGQSDLMASGLRERSSSIKLFLNSQQVANALGCLNLAEMVCCRRICVSSGLCRKGTEALTQKGIIQDIVPGSSKLEKTAK
ncbi:hypothetical protein AV530_012027 [Patagioenas fasciata monilis]|uniref:Uncharacterized protein n=1 Tax=Patagioenas fasciata monilis TaxID=372326 RepID=A0A1V4JUJ6_PATFA|nr:hypothetical protein AV530_012027 [Patagioenas fasciata monilis]